MRPAIIGPIAPPIILLEATNVLITPCDLNTNSSATIGEYEVTNLLKATPKRATKMQGKKSSVKTKDLF